MDSGQAVTIVMYHYVRPLARSRFPRLRALDLDRFVGQLDYLCRHYTPVAIEDVIAAARDGGGLPPNPVLLTFDDGFSDHYRYAFPLLHERGIRGAFYPPAGAVLDRRMLEVHKIHCLLATVTDHDRLAADMEKLVTEAHREAPRTVADPAVYRDRWHHGDGLDTPVVVYLKSMMQHALPDPWRDHIADALFRAHVSADEVAVAEEFYVTPEQLRVMADNGMHVGGHGDRHLWHSRIPTAGKQAEIAGAQRMMERIGLGGRPWTYCYPNGDYDAETIALLQAAGCEAAVIVGDAVARLKTSREGAGDDLMEPRDGLMEPCDGLMELRDGLMELPRLDTTRFPTSGDAPFRAL